MIKKLLDSSGLPQETRGEALLATLWLVVMGLCGWLIVLMLGIVVWQYWLAFNVIGLFVAAVAIVAVVKLYAAVRASQ